MLQDYEISRKNTKDSKWLLFIEFALILIILHLTIVLFFGSVEGEESMRFRLLAHSNTQEDQAMKSEIQREIEPILQKVLSAANTVDEIEVGLAKVESEILTIAGLTAKEIPVTLERTNALFPPKKLGGVIRPQAKYDAYVLTIGSGRGDNFWCSLFPSICFQDQKDEAEEKVTFFLWEWLKALFS